MEGNLAFIFPHTDPRSAASGALLRFGWRLNTVDHIDLAADALCFQSNSKNPLPHPLGSQCALSPTTSPTRHRNPRGAAFCHMCRQAAGFTRWSMAIVVRHIVAGDDMPHLPTIPLAYNRHVSDFILQLS
jgi:hypothetical protein